MPSGSSKSKPKPADVASETKRKYIPLIREEYSGQYNIYSYMFFQPLLQINFGQRQCDFTPPCFCKARSASVLTLRSADVNGPDVYPGDPADGAANWAKEAGIEIPFICSANDGRPGGDWETGAAGYEERLCRRSTLSANLSTPGPIGQDKAHYPLPMFGCVVSPQVGKLPHHARSPSRC